MAVTWETIKFFDDIISQPEREIILDTEKHAESRCRYLCKDGKLFFYCGLNIPDVKDRTPSPANPLYTRHVDVATLQLHCLDNFETCCHYSGKLPR